MTKFVLRRLVWTIPVILLVILLTFMMMRQIGGNPFRHTERAVPASIQAQPRARSSTSTSPGTSSTSST